MTFAELQITPFCNGIARLTRIACELAELWALPPTLGVWKSEEAPQGSIFDLRSKVWFKSAID